LTRQRGALAQREANVRRSALIGVVCAPRASSAKRQRTHFFARWPGRSKLRSRIVIRRWATS